MNCFVYRHLKKDTKELFYIGIGTNYCYKKHGRAYSKFNRSGWWNNIVKKHGFIWEIIYDNLSQEDAKSKECELISLYGRLDLGTGLLCNQTAGGDGINSFKHSEENKLKARERVNYYNSIGKNPRLGKTHSEESKEKMRKAKLGKIMNSKQSFRNAKSIGLYIVYKNDLLIGEYVSSTDVFENTGLPPRSVSTLTKSGNVGKKGKSKDYKIKFIPK